jgi:hypothetical protein
MVVNDSIRVHAVILDAQCKVVRSAAKPESTAIPARAPRPTEDTRKSPHLKDRFRFRGKFHFRFHEDLRAFELIL